MTRKLFLEDSFPDFVQTHRGAGIAGQIRVPPEDLRETFVWLSDRPRAGGQPGGDRTEGPAGGAEARSEDRERLEELAREVEP